MWVFTCSCFPLGWWGTLAFYKFLSLWQGTSIILKMKVIYLKFLRWGFSNQSLPITQWAFPMELARLELLIYTKSILVLPVFHRLRIWKHVFTRILGCWPAFWVRQHLRISPKNYNYSPYLHPNLVKNCKIFQSKAEFGHHLDYPAPKTWSKYTAIIDNHN